jgi:hypothetical protein
MLKFINNNFCNHTICLLLAVVFLSSFPTGAAALALCLDQEENHIVDQDFYLDDCHSSIGTYLPLSDEHCDARTERENNNCVDISLTNANTINIPSKVLLPAFSKNILSYVVPNRIIRFEQQAGGQSSSVFSQYLPTSSHLNQQRTIVLLV